MLCSYRWLHVKHYVKTTCEIVGKDWWCFCNLIVTLGKGSHVMLAEVQFKYY